MQPRRKSAGRRLIEWLRDTSAKLYSLTWIAQFAWSAWGFINGVTPFIKSAGELFPPIAYSFDGLKELFSIFFPPPKERAAEINSFLSKASSLTKLGLNALTVTIFLGIFATTPIGWAIAAGTTTIGWVVDDIIPAWNSWNKYQADLKEVEKLTTLLNFSSSLTAPLSEAQKNDLQEQLAVANNNAEQSYKTFSKKRSDVLWGTLAVAGMALFAMGTFGFGAVGIIGTVLFVAVAARGVIGRLAKTDPKKVKAKAPEAAENSLDVNPDLDFELSSKNTNTLTVAPPPPALTVAAAAPLTPKTPATSHRFMMDKFRQAKEPAVTSTPQPFPTTSGELPFRRTAKSGEKDKGIPEHTVQIPKQTNK